MCNTALYFFFVSKEYFSRSNFAFISFFISSFFFSFNFRFILRKERTQQILPSLREMPSKKSFERKIISFCFVVWKVSGWREYNDFFFFLFDLKNHLYSIYVLFLFQQYGYAKKAKIFNIKILLSFNFDYFFLLRNKNLFSV